MKQYLKSIGIALACFLLVILLNFALPRLLPGDPVAYLSGFAEQDLTTAQIERYRTELHLDEPVLSQFGYYLKSLADGTLGYSFKKNAVVSDLIRERIGATLQISLPAVVLSTLIGLIWGLNAGYRRDGVFDRLSTAALILLNTVPSSTARMVALGLGHILESLYSSTR